MLSYLYLVNGKKEMNKWMNEWMNESAMFLCYINVHVYVVVNFLSQVIFFSVFGYGNVC